MDTKHILILNKSTATTILRSSSPSSSSHPSPSFLYPHILLPFALHVRSVLAYSTVRFRLFRRPSKRVLHNPYSVHLCHSRHPSQHPHFRHIQCLLLRFLHSAPYIIAGLATSILFRDHQVDSSNFLITQNPGTFFQFLTNSIDSLLNYSIDYTSLFVELSTERSDSVTTGRCDWWRGPGGHPRVP